MKRGNDYFIKWPGPWLDEEITEKEYTDVKQYLTRIEEIRRRGGVKVFPPSSPDPTIITPEGAAFFSELSPFLNSVMHLTYSLAKSGKLPPWILKDPVGATSAIAAALLEEGTTEQLPGQMSIDGTQEQLSPEAAIIHAADNAAFSSIRQGTATNTLTKIRPTGRNTTIDAITGAATIKQGGMTVTFPSFETIDGLKTSTYKLLDAITEVFTTRGSADPVVTLDLAEYMKKCGLKDRKQARAQAQKDLETLRTAAISFKERRRGADAGYYKMNISGGAGITRSGIMMFTFSQDFFNIIKKYPRMPYPTLLYQLNGKRNPNSYYLLRKIAEHKYMNSGKANEDTISVKTLLSAAAFIPSYKEVSKSDRHYDTRIIEPFERDMDALSTALKWEYCHSNHAPLTDGELSALDYEAFSGLLVHIIWEQYPDQTPRLEKRAAAIEAAKEIRKTTAKKGVTHRTAGGNAPHSGG